MANKVMRVDGTAGSTRAYKSFTGVDEVFLTFDLLIQAADFASGFTGDIGGIGWGTYDGLGHLGGSGLISIYEEDDNPPFDGNDTWWMDYTPAGDSSAESDTTPAPLADTWQTIEIHYSKGVLHDVVVDGTTVTGLSGTNTDTHQAEAIAVGQSFGGVVVFLDNVKVGTTRGGSDIFSDDFESGSLSAGWTGTILGAAITVVDDPNPPAGGLIDSGTIAATSTVSGLIQLRGILGPAGPILATSSVGGSIRLPRITTSTILATSTVSGRVAKRFRLLPSSISATSSVSGLVGRKIFIFPTTIFATATVETSVDDIIVYVPPEVFTSPTGPGYPALGPAAASPDGYFIDTLSHHFALTQTYRAETLRFKQIIREVQDADWEISLSQVNSRGRPIVWRRLLDNADFMLPMQNHFRIRYKEAGVETPIMAGFIKSTNGAKGRDFMKVAGVDWLAYLDRRQIPFNPLEPEATYADENFFGPSTPPAGYSYQVAGRDIFRIVHDILEFVLSKPRSLPLDISDPGTTFMGNVINYALALGDTSTALNLITGLSEYWPGFDFMIGYNRNFEVWTPARFGDPDDTANSGPDGDNIAYAFGDDFNHPIMDVEYTNSGVKATHLLGTGAGSTANRVAKAIGAGDIQKQFWRLDDSIDFGDQAKTQDIVAKRTRREFIFKHRELHEIELTIDPSTVEDFHTVIKPGYAIWLRDDLQFHEIDSAQKIISIEMTVDNQGDRTAVLGLNQIYDTSKLYGVDEA